MQCEFCLKEFEYKGQDFIDYIICDECYFGDDKKALAAWLAIADK